MRRRLRKGEQIGLSLIGRYIRAYICMYVRTYTFFSSTIFSLVHKLQTSVSTYVFDQ